MPREYRHIEIHEKEIIRIWQEGKTLREIREMLGFSYKQQRDFKTRYNQKQRKIATGIFLPRTLPKRTIILIVHIIFCLILYDWIPWMLFTGKLIYYSMQ